MIRYQCRLVLVLAFSMGLVSSAEAINIVPVFNNADNETPAFDLFNQGIQDLFAYSETYYQDILEDGGYTVTLNFWYEDLSGSILGLFNPVTTVGDRVTEANIRIDTKLELGGVFRDWFIDSTPATDVEFEMTKHLWKDLGVRQFDYIAPVDTPDSFEAGYIGLAANGSPAEFKYDMLSVILHEIGHALGINNGAAENNDGDYDMNPDFLFGKEVAAKISTRDGQPDPAHMLSSTLLMCGGCGGTNLRRRPSHADIFAMATSSGLTDIDVPNREFYGGGVFNLDGNWSGNRTPDFNDNAFMRSAGLVVMNASHATADLTIIDSTTLATGSNILTVNGTLTLENRFSNSTAEVVVGAGGVLNADNIDVNRNGQIDLAGGTVNVAGDLNLNESAFANDDEGTITGNGTINVGGTLTSVGIIRPTGGDLTITAAQFDLDGSDADFGLGHIDATAGSVTFNGPHIDTFDDLIDIGFARLVTFSDPWTLGPTGELNITDGGLINNGAWQADGIIVIDHTVEFGVVGVGGTGSMTLGATGQVTTSGVVDFLGSSTIEGSIHVTTGAARFSSGGTFTDSAVVTLDAGTTMNLIFANTYTIENNATFTGLGTLTIAGLATVILEDGLDLGVPMLNKGRMEIGLSPGEVTVQADFEQDATGVSQFEIGGLMQGREYDFLNVTGFTATLAGTLELSLISGFTPTAGDSFQIIAADSILGTFPTLIGADIGGGLMFEVIYNLTNVTVHVTGLPIPGDLNGDGFVGIADLNIVLGNWNALVDAGVWIGGDPTGDGFVGIEDLNIVLGNWNAGTPPGVPGEGAVIPEPGTLGSISLGAWTLLRRGKRGCRPSA